MGSPGTRVIKSLLHTGGIVSCGIDCGNKILKRRKLIRDINYMSQSTYYMEGSEANQYKSNIP